MNNIKFVINKLKSNFLIVLYKFKLCYIVFFNFILIQIPEAIKSDISRLRRHFNSSSAEANFRLNRARQLKEYRISLRLDPFVVLIKTGIRNLDKIEHGLIEINHSQYRKILSYYKKEEIARENALFGKQ